MKFYNRIVDKGQLKKLISWAFTNYGSALCSQMADELKNMGFRYATRAGVSISVEDLKIPPVKRQMLEEAETEVRITENRYAKGEITEVERFQKVIDTWNGTSEALKDEVVRNFRATDPLNSVYMMAFSGARGNLSQVRQLVGMRGLMADPQGEIIGIPIKTNFREGLTVTEYIISSYGARKGLVDTALRTADSGYLTRRLVDVSQDVIVREIDCGTERGITVGNMTDGDRILIPLGKRLLGRVLARDVVDPETGEIIATKNQHLDEETCQAIGKAVDEVFVRSPLTCEASRSVCQSCYGWSLAHGRPVDLGEAVGIIAAQSIGEPGTQLTMRTFHTGGVFTGEVARQLRAPFAGTVKLGKKVRTRVVRTRHGDERDQVEVAGELIVEETGGSKSKTFQVTPGSLLLVKPDQEVGTDELLAEIALGKPKRSTEKAAKEVNADLAGEVLFADLPTEEKTDRQGNTTRTAQRGGLMWVACGQVYNLLPGAEPAVENGQTIEAGAVLAQTQLVSSHGGVVRLTPGSREIEIITASVRLDQAKVKKSSVGGREQYIVTTARGDRFLLKTTPGTKVISGQVVAELVDESYRTETGGMIKYADIEIAKRGKSKGERGYEVTKGGSLLWIPEECHEVNKDISLLLVEDGEYVEAGTEVVKDVWCQSSGVVEVVQKNDILREIVIKPGDLHLLSDGVSADQTEPFLIQPGTEVVPGLVVDKLCYGEYGSSVEGETLLLRPVKEYIIHNEQAVPSQDSINQSGHVPISLRSVQRVLYKDGERVKSVEGLELVRTQLVLDIITEQESDLESSQPLSADIELVSLSEETDPESEEEESVLQMVILESLVLRRDMEADAHGGSTKTKVLVNDGQEIPPGAVIARTEIQCKEPGEIRGIHEGTEAVRRVLVVRDSDLIHIDLNSNQSAEIKVGDLVIAGAEVAPGVVASESGQCVAITDDRISLRLARPYRVSAGAMLQVNDGDLVQRGDNLVLLVFERSKTGDIIQGLPRIEELLEARKPKEACILARRPGTSQVVYEADETVDVKIVEADGVVADYPVSPGQNVMVSDNQQIEAGVALTDGPANPHEILELFFELYVGELGVYEAALKGLQAAQRFLVTEVQLVYQSQGIDISDKHIEVIVRQMTSKVRVDDGGDTTMLPGELVELRQIEQVNDAMAITGGAPARYTPVLLGITKASLNTDSFISAASFQETTRVLTEAAIEGKSDWLRGLKENVIIGRLIPAGTGFNQHTDDTVSHSLEYDGGIGGMPIGQSYNMENNDFSLDQNVRRNFSEDENVILDDQTARAYTGSDFGFTPRSNFSTFLDDSQDLNDDEI